MKKAALAALLFATVTTAVLAQAPAKQQKQANTTQSAPKTLDQRADEITAGMVKNLRLVPDQAKKLQAVNRNSIRQAEEARTKYKSDPRKLAQQMDIISQTRLSLIKDILTEQQFAQYQSRREEKLLRDRGEEKIGHAISAHYTHWGVPYETTLDKALIACDELTGFIVVCAQVRPQRLEGLEAKSVIKKLGAKSFAASVDRDEVCKGAELFGVDMKEHINFIIAVLQQNQQELQLEPQENTQA